LEKCQEHEKTQMSEVTAVTTHDYEEEKMDVIIILISVVAMWKT